MTDKEVFASKLTQMVSGMFSRLGEHWFDDYWMNYKKIIIPDGKGGTKKIATLKEFIEYKGKNSSLIVEPKDR